MFHVSKVAVFVCEKRNALCVYTLYAHTSESKKDNYIRQTRKPVSLAFGRGYRTIQPELKPPIFWVLHWILISFFEQSCFVSSESLWPTKENLKTTIKCQKLNFLRISRKLVNQFWHNFFQRRPKITKLGSLERPVNFDSVCVIFIFLKQIKVCLLIKTLHLMCECDVLFNEVK